MLGKLVVDGTPEDSIPFDNPDERNLVEEVSMKVASARSLLICCVINAMLKFSIALFRPSYRYLLPGLSPGAPSFQPQRKFANHGGGLRHQVQPDPLPGSERGLRHRRTLGPPAGQRRSVRRMAVRCLSEARNWPEDSAAASSNVLPVCKYLFSLFRQQ